MVKDYKWVNMGSVGTSNERLSLAVFISHPIQHFSPLFKELAQLVDLHVFYYSDFAQKSGQVDPGFSVPVQWDVPLLDGYEYTFLEPVPWQTQSYLGRWRQNRGIWGKMARRSWDGVLLFGYSCPSDWIVWLGAVLMNIPILLISDSELLHGRPLVKMTLKEVPVRLFYSRLRVFLAVGDNNKSYALRYGIPEDKIRPAVLPVDIRRFRGMTELSDVTVRLDGLRRKYDIPPHSKIILFCGKLVDYKRPMDLAQALNKLDVGQGVIGLFVGDGTLKQQVLNVGGEHVRVTGFVNQNEIPLHYLLGDVLVVPSERDPHPLVVTEAACLGIPSIVSDRVGCVGPTDVVRENESGLVYPCGDVTQLAEMLKMILLDDEVRVRFGKRALEISETQSPQAAANKIHAAMLGLYPDRKQ